MAEQVEIRFRVSPDTAALIRDTIEGLAAKNVARYSRATFMEAAAEHYANHLARLHNDGTRWGTDSPAVPDNATTSIAGNVRGVRLPAQWAIPDRPRQPRRVWLATEAQGNAVINAQINVGAIHDPGDHTSLTRILQFAGFEIDPDREERTDDYGQTLVPIRELYGKRA